MKRHAPATARNSEPIAAVLAQELPESGLVLEVASGTGEHAVFMARRFPWLNWQPTDLDVEALASVDAYAEETDQTNLRSAVALDAVNPKWLLDRADAIVCINMVHISPWDATEGLFAGAQRLLAQGAPLVLYGPYIEPEIETSESNLQFDTSLKTRDPRWGLRSTHDMDKLAEQNGFNRTARFAMPANNLTLVYRKTS